jgi:hypothetical protein
MDTSENQSTESSDKTSSAVSIATQTHAWYSRK